MPFGYNCEFPDFDACVAANQDKDNPEAYCAALMEETEEMCQNRGLAPGRSSDKGEEGMSDRLEFVTAKQFKERQKEGESKSLGVRKGYALSEVKRIDDGEDGLLLSMTISTADLDRDGDTIAVEGWELGDYKKNPVVLFAHSHSDPPVGKSVKIWTEEGKLRSQTRFTPHDLNPFGHMIGRLYEEGYMRATSVGFLPLEWEEAKDRRSEGPFFMPMDFKRQTLLEYSAVPVPANPNALADAKAKGVVDLSPMIEWAERVLDEAGEGVKGLWVPRKTVESIYSLLTKDVTISVPSSGSIKNEEEPKGDEDETIGVTEEPPGAKEPEHQDAGESESLDSQEPKSQDGLSRWKVILEVNGKGRIEVDGEPVKGVRAVEVRAGVDGPPSLVLDVIPGQLEIEGESEGFEKRGRVLSAANENRLTRARDLIDEVLASATDQEEEDEKGLNGVSPKEASAQGDDGEVLIELALDEPEAEQGDELSFDPEELKEIILRAVETNINRIRGRVD